MSLRNGLRRLAALLAAATVAAHAAPPAAPSRPVVDVIHGTRVADPYRNLENLKDPETRAWLQSQGEDTAAVLARIEARQAIAERIESLGLAVGDAVVDVLRMPGGRTYYLRRKAAENQFKLVMRSGGAQGTERVLVDLEPLSKSSGTPHAINYFMPSWDGASLAYGVSSGGSEDASLRVLDIASGKELIRPIPRVHERLVHWSPDSRSVTFNQLRELPAGASDTETYFDSTVFAVWPRSASPVPRPLFGRLVDTRLKLDRLDVGAVMFSPSGRYMVARTTDTTLPEGRLFVAPLAQLGARRIAWKQISAFGDKIRAVQLHGDTLYLASFAGAPHGRVLALPLDRPALSQARVVVPEPSEGSLEGFSVVPGAVFAEVRNGFEVRVRRHATGTIDGGVDPAPGLAGSLTLADDEAGAYTEPWLLNRSWTAPPRLYALTRDGRAADTRIVAGTAPAGVPEIEATEVLVPSHDGARVPLAILHKKGLALDGTNPTLLVGYGAYGLSFEPFFDARSIAWMERGGVLAFANVRGSGAYGEAWYRAGFKNTKPNTWKDGIAAARYLIEQKYASPQTLGIWGTSAGGIFVGRAVTTAPELFAAAIFDVGIMDAVRAEESANGITNISEFGSVKNVDEFRALLEMSTYHQIVDGISYPAVMFIHGLNDPRVDVWHSAKAAARLQAATGSGKPILMRLDGQAGHGVGSTAAQRASKQADIYAFLLWQFGKVGLAP